MTHGTNERKFQPEKKYPLVSSYMYKNIHNTYNLLSDAPTLRVFELCRIIFDTNDTKRKKQLILLNLVLVYYIN